MCQQRRRIACKSNLRNRREWRDSLCASETRTGALISPGPAHVGTLAMWLRCCRSHQDFGSGRRHRATARGPIRTFRCSYHCNARGNSVCRSSVVFLGASLISVCERLAENLQITQITTGSGLRLTISYETASSSLSRFAICI
jgi:hypothetical protein